MGTREIQTINLMGVAKTPRYERYQPLIDHLLHNQPDVVLLQEGIGGLSVCTRSSIKDINNRLPKLYTVTLASMSHWLAYPIQHYDIGIFTKVAPSRVLSSNLDTFSGAPSLVEKFVYSGGARALAVLIISKGAKPFWATSVHLDYTQGMKGFERQALALQNLLQEMSRLCSNIIIGGDFNFDIINAPSEHPIKAILETCGLSSPIFKNPRPTHGMENNPYCTTVNPKVIDAIFFSKSFQTTFSEINFSSPKTFISDHCGFRVAFSI